MADLNFESHVTMTVLTITRNSEGKAIGISGQNITNVDVNLLKPIVKAHQEECKEAVSSRCGYPLKSAYFTEKVVEEFIDEESIVVPLP